MPRRDTPSSFATRVEQLVLAVLVIGSGVMTAAAIVAAVIRWLGLYPTG